MGRASLLGNRNSTMPFVLLDDARSGADRARLLANPVEIVATRDPADIPDCLGKVRAAQACGLHAAGFLAYEAGHALEPRLTRLCTAPPADQPPLLWFGLFERAEEIESPDTLLPDPAGAWSGPARPRIERAGYEAAVAHVKAHIDAGNVYQANLTFAAEVRTAGHPLALYAALRDQARAGHGGIVFTGEHWLLSFSPELFFTLEGGRLTTRPMKGTATRRPDPAEDKAAAAALREDPKQRAENLMIVDLLRNDLSRVSKAGSVKVPALFEVETYPTVHQMTSTVVAEIEEGRDAVDVLEAIFPCGSITGAPKIRAMELIAEIEAGPRHAYTGSIGHIAPGGEATFNVAIRTLTIKAGEDRAIIGLGSGIVADSRAGDEWRECLAKGKFVATRRSFDLIETMRFDPRDGIMDLERHLLRLKHSAQAFDFRFDRHDVRNEIQAATFRHRDPKKVRLLLSRAGTVAIESAPAPEPIHRAVTVALAQRPVAADDFRLRHKTSDRTFYDEARRASDAFEVVFVDDDGFLTEGSFTNIFVQRGGTLVTPPLARGLLPGILRQRLIEQGDAEERDLVPADLAGGFLIGNAVRGLLRARLAQAPIQDPSAKEAAETEQ
ncbi:aminodeoxychorismate synthase component I [Sphingosinicella sp. LY1275]|uniref:aminodeoxychorismate synthase component I n=1 Tax=Sphingosinicella sp. LY1275 TaxID=3095379 RepID=UPI002ADECD3C|nr:aminodeoxychorismate synthase component I [Sphingosinicella sp. LY1275]MEA1014078.1 aminodeoxychorismate synthase component I [Sphingosinicella sp. LY1275]